MFFRVTPSVDLVVHPTFDRVGLADTGIGKVAGQGTVILTDDFGLYLVLTETRTARHQL